jgi:uncharacterized protein YbjQ (UPF0145 family)
LILIVRPDDPALDRMSANLTSLRQFGQEFSCRPSPLPGPGLSLAPATRRRRMIISTTPTLEGRPVREYLGIVTGEVIVGANIFKDLFAGIRDIVGGRAGAYEGALRDARRQAYDELAYEAERMGADAVVGVDLDYEVVGANGAMLMVSISGTAVRL